MVEQKENDDREHEPSKQRTLLKKAIQDAIIDLIKADRSYSQTKSDRQLLKQCLPLSFSMELLYHTS